jgi:hypothetical protein
VSWLDHESVALPPELMLVVLVDKLSEGMPPDESLVATETAAERVMLPPAPVHVSL